MISLSEKDADKILLILRAYLETTNEHIEKIKEIKNASMEKLDNLPAKMLKMFLSVGNAQDEVLDSFLEKKNEIEYLILALTAGSSE